MKTPKPTESWPQFMKAVRLRMEKESKVYGDHSFLRPPGGLAVEVEEELLDVVGWSFILWTRVRNLGNIIKENHD